MKSSSQAAALSVIAIIATVCLGRPFCYQIVHYRANAYCVRVSRHLIATIQLFLQTKAEKSCDYPK